MASPIFYKSKEEALQVLEEEILNCSSKNNNFIKARAAILKFKENVTSENDIVKKLGVPTSEEEGSTEATKYLKYKIMSCASQLEKTMHSYLVETLYLHLEFTVTIGKFDGLAKKIVVGEEIYYAP